MEKRTLRAPAVPLISVDPYFSVWSMADRLPDDHTRHWTGSTCSMAGMLKIDGKPVRFMGRLHQDEVRNGDRNQVLGMAQTHVEVRPTRTLYRFEAHGVELSLTFTTPLLPDDLLVLSRPVTYVDAELRALDGHEHAVALYMDGSHEFCVNDKLDDAVMGRVQLEGGLTSLTLTNANPQPLVNDGDDLRVEWGRFHLVTDAGTPMQGNFTQRVAWAMNREPRAQDGLLVSAFVREFRVGAVPVRARYLYAYDDLNHSIRFQGKTLAAWWTRSGMRFEQMLRAAWREADAILARCDAFDARVIDEARGAGGAQYAEICALAYRQCICAHKLVDCGGTPYLFSKENFSNGCMATVDISYPSMPLFLLYCPELVRGMARPVMDFARTPDWKYAFAPHDVGRYPVGDIQRYGLLPNRELALEAQMPVEESGNMLLLACGACIAEGDAAFALENRDLLDRWADYLLEHGADPENQLCTDDFAGHLARNANLAMKAIVALGAYGKTLSDAGADGSKWSRAAARMAKTWLEMAGEGDHTVLAFGSPDSWSLKYNLIWDELMDLRLFPDALRLSECAWYRRVMDRYGVALDSRRAYTKADWVIWAACLSGIDSDFEELTAGVWRFLDETPDRVPFCDWYGTQDRLQQAFQARAVVGGVFIRILQKRWEKAQ